jgi:hypothetical protein
VGWPARRFANPVVPLQEVPPHIDREGAKEGPLKDVQPAEGVTSQSPPKLEAECTAADREPGEQGEVEPEGVLSCQADWTLIGPGPVAEVTRLHGRNAIAGVARQELGSFALARHLPVYPLRPLATIGTTEQSRKAGEGERWLATQSRPMV